MSGPRIRLAQAHDAESMTEFERAAAVLFSQDAELAYLPLSEGRSSDAYAKPIRRGRCLVAAEDDAVIGFIACEPFGRALHVWELGVRPDRQRAGTGSLLLRAAMVDARTSGFATLTLTTFRDHPWNAPFYVRRGFREVDPADHPRLAKLLEAEEEAGLPRERRCAMICFLD